MGTKIVIRMTGTLTVLGTRTVLGRRDWAHRAGNQTALAHHDWEP